MAPRPRPPRAAPTIVERASFQVSPQDASAARLGHADGVTVRVVLATVRGTGYWTVEVILDGESPLLDGKDGVALAIRKVRYDELRARTLYATVLRAIAHADLPLLRKTSLLRERVDPFFCWAFGLVSLEDSLAGRRARFGTGPRARRPSP